MTRNLSLDGLSLLARGGQAEIYDLGNGKVLRVAKRPRDFERIRYEYGVYASLADSPLSVPQAFELVTVGEAPAIVMEKVSGPSMMDLVTRNPLRATSLATELARLHVELSKVKATEGITLAKAKAEACIKRSEKIDDASKERILKMLHELPDGDTLCHGDFHPGNILYANGKSYLIDWVGASRGDFYSDIAHSYLLLRVVPRVPHMNRVMHFLQKRIGMTIAGRYLRAVLPESDADTARLSRWVLVNAAERTYFGLESEQDQLQRFIRKYFEVLDRSGSEDLLYRKI